MSVKNQDNLEIIEEKDVEQSQEEKPAEIPKKKAINLSDEERQRRSERMKKLREKLDNIGSVPKVKPPEPSKRKTIPKKEVVHVNNESDESDESEEDEPVKPVKKIQKNKVKETPKKAMPRKVLKIKYYHEPTQAEMLQDRLFLENQHRQDNEYTLNKNKKEENKKSHDDISDKLFNY